VKRDAQPGTDTIKPLGLRTRGKGQESHFRAGGHRRFRDRWQNLLRHRLSEATEAQHDCGSDDEGKDHAEWSAGKRCQ
jgi:hypothetical protein